MIDLASLCDSSDAAWPLGWQEDFGPYNFFYVAGLTDYFAAKGKTVVDHVASNLLKATDEDQPLYPNEWLTHFPGNVDDENFQRAHLGVLGVGVMKTVIGRGPVAFGKAAMTVYRFLQYVEQSDSDAAFENTVQIRFACWFLPGFNFVYHQLTDAEKTNLQLHTRQRSCRVFDEMAMGYPVTRDLAKKVKGFIETKSSVGKGINITIQAYPERLEIRRMVQDLTDEIVTNETLRVAGGERVQW